MEQKVTLSQLNNRIREALIEAIPTTVWVVAEISELKENRSGHCYLELIEKDEENIIARARATIWSYTFRMLKPYFETTTGQTFSSGIKILVQVSVEYHPAYGLSLNIKDIDPTYTVGDLAIQRKEIVERLQKEGVFEMNKELDLPVVPQKIAVISSASAAGYQDFMDQLQNNEYGFRFYTRLFEASMQGEETVPTIINALERIFQYEDFFDAVVIIRGGGASADLVSFDNYDLAFNVTQFPIPVVTGIGHEKDDTIIDLVAHTRMKTPTAVAEFFITGTARFYDRLRDIEETLISLTKGKIELEYTRLERMVENMAYSTSAFIKDQNSRLTLTGSSLQKTIGQHAYNRNYELNNFQHDLKKVLALSMLEYENEIEQKQHLLKRVTGEKVSKESAVIERYRSELSKQLENKIYKEKDKIQNIENSLRLLDPVNILRRGYSLTLKEGEIVKSSKDLHTDEEIETRFYDGSVKSKIIKKG